MIWNEYNNDDSVCQTESSYMGYLTIVLIFMFFQCVFAEGDNIFLEPPEDEALLNEEETSPKVSEQAQKKTFIARLKALNKITGKVSILNIKVGETVQFERLTMKVHFCERSPPEDPPEVKVFLEIKEDVAYKKHQQIVFSNWMFASAPALSAMEHPIYDIWVIDAEPL